VVQGFSLLVMALLGCFVPSSVTILRILRLANIITAVDATTFVRVRPMLVVVGAKIHAHSLHIVTGRINIFTSDRSLDGISHPIDDVPQPIKERIDCLIVSLCVHCISSLFVTSNRAPSVFVCESGQSLSGLRAPSCAAENA